MRNVTIAEFYKEYNCLSGKVYLYGASVTGRGILRMLESFSVNVEAFIDKDQSKCQKPFCGYKVVLPKDVPQDACIIITTSMWFVDSIAKMLTEEYGITEIFYFQLESIVVKQRFFLTGYDADKIEEYEEQYQSFIDTCDAIEIYPMWADRIGEFIYRYMIMYEDAKKNNTHYIILPYVFGDVTYANTRLMDIISRQSQMIYGDNEKFWAYVIENHAMRLKFYDTFLHTIEAYNEMKGLPWKEALYYLQDSSPIVQFSEKEYKEAWEKMDQLGIKEPFICVFARDSAYLAQRSDVFSYHDYRDYNIKNFNLLIKYLKGENVQVVRVGTVSKGCLEGENVVDITNDNYDEILDLYVNSKCMWWIGCNSGAEEIPGLFRRKKIGINISNIIDTYWTSLYCMNRGCCYIPKLYYSYKKQRYLNIREMCKLNLSDVPPHLYEQEFGVRLVENSPEDILEVYQECESKTNGIWEYTVMEEKLQKKYQLILDEISGEYPNGFGGYTYSTKESMPPVPIGTTFLKKYKNILLD